MAVISMICGVSGLAGLASAVGNATTDLNPLPVADAKPAWRQPIGLAWSQNRLFAANSRTGTLSMLDAAGGDVQAEWRVAESLSGLRSWNQNLLLLDDTAHRLIIVHPETDSGQLLMHQSIELPNTPVGIDVSPDQQRIAVSSLWARQLTLLHTDSEVSLRTAATMDLPFAPRCVLFISDRHLIVADSFGGQLAVLDAIEARVLSLRRVHGHNIRGLSLNHEQTSLNVTHQNLDSEAFISYEQVFWGVVMQNGLHMLPLKELLDSERSDAAADVAQAGYGLTPASDRRVYPLGTPSIGSGDPGSILVTRSDTSLLLLSGVSQLAYRTASHLPFSRLATGRRPESICLDTDHTLAFIANRFDDSVTVVSLSGDQPKVTKTISLGTVRELTLAEEGEQLFYDATLSLDGWYSCHSCHSNGHTNSRLSDTLGDEGQGAPKQVLTLLGNGETAPWAWNGSKASLEQQIHTSLVMSMQTQLPSDQLPTARLAAYVRSLAPAPGILAARRQMPDEAQLQAGRRLFESVGCADCHAGTALTSDAVYDVGIHDETDGREFNPPSLRGVSQRSPYFHDGRAASLQEVLDSGHHGAEAGLTSTELETLEIYLKTL